MTSHTVPQIYALAQQHHQAGRLFEAEPLYRQILSEQPRHPDALHYLGVIAHQLGQNEKAVDLIRQALVVRPNYPEAISNLANALKGIGELDDAIANFRKATLLLPKSADIHNNCGIALLENNQFDEAVISFRKAVKLNPQFSDAYSNLSHALLARLQVDEALITARKAVALNPNNASGLGNLGNALRDSGNTDDALLAYQKLLGLQPDNPDAHLNYAIALLLRGEFAQGWEEYERRWDCPGYTSMNRSFSQPQWDGASIPGKTLLLHAEQGLGDAILFSRYLPLIAQRVWRDAQAQIVFEIHPELEQLFKTYATHCRIVLRGQPLPAFDVQCRLLSLPRIFKTDLKSIPAEIPYLFPEPELVEYWHTKLGAGSELKIALAWAGNPAFKGDKARSMSLEVLSPLSAVKGVKYFSIQKGYAQQQLLKPPTGLQLIDLSSDLENFADTAAVMMSTDLIITTDTSVAHLAGALGRPVWLMLQFVPYFMWMLNRNDSPWYPTMRLFRQPARADWKSVMQQIVQSLNQVVALRNQNSTSR